MDCSASALHGFSGEDPSLLCATSQPGFPLAAFELQARHFRLKCSNFALLLHLHIVLIDVDVRTLFCLQNGNNFVFVLFIKVPLADTCRRVVQNVSPDSASSCCVQWSPTSTLDNDVRRRLSNIACSSSNA